MNTTKQDQKIYTGLSYVKCPLFALLLENAISMKERYKTESFLYLSVIYYAVSVYLYVSHKYLIYRTPFSNLDSLLSL